MADGGANSGFACPRALFAGGELGRLKDGAGHGESALRVAGCSDGRCTRAADRTIVR